MDSKPTTITADELQSLRAVKDEPLKDPFNLRALLDKGLVVIHNNGMSLTPTGREVLAQAEMQQTAPTSEDAPTGAGDTDYRDLYLSASGSLAIIASWLRGSKGDMDDLTTQNLYDMIANEQGMSAQTITTVLVEQTELAALREQVAALTASLRFCGDMADGLHNHISVRGAMGADEVIRTLGLITKRAQS